MVDRLVDELAQLAEDKTVRVVAIRGAGPSFCAGFDLAADGAVVSAAVTNDPVQEQRRLQRTLDRLFAVWDCPKPVFAAVHGNCRAGGAMLATLCDLTIVAETARIGVSAIPLGGGYITPLMAHLIGPKRAKQLAFQPGETISGVEATAWGWANAAAAEERLLDEVRAVAVRTARTPSETLRLKKYAINRLYELQGFRAQAMLGAEIDALLHFGRDTAPVWESLERNGLRATIRSFEEGGFA
jgi:enoyl-CoA hydratase